MKRITGYHTQYKGIDLTLADWATEEEIEAMLRDPSHPAVLWRSDKVDTWEMGQHVSASAAPATTSEK